MRNPGLTSLRSRGGSYDQQDVVANSARLLPFPGGSNQTQQQLQHARQQQSHEVQTAVLEPPRFRTLSKDSTAAFSATVQLQQQMLSQHNTQNTHNTHYMPNNDHNQPQPHNKPPPGTQQHQLHHQLSDNSMRYSRSYDEYLEGTQQQNNIMHVNYDEVSCAITVVCYTCKSL